LYPASLVVKPQLGEMSEELGQWTFLGNKKKTKPKVLS
jgi:hypothetical protein